ncbi:MAG: fumarylacetoacetase, partial [Pseudomonadota bacterium]
MHPNTPSLKSFLPIDPSSDFPIQNLPFGIFSTRLSPELRVGVAIGEWVLDLAELEKIGLLSPGSQPVFNKPALNDFIALGQSVWRSTRAQISLLLRSDHP